MKVGDKVYNRMAIDKTPGTVVLVSVPGMADCALVQWRSTSDGLCIPRNMLVVVPQQPQLREVDEDRLGFGVERSEP